MRSVLTRGLFVVACGLLLATQFSVGGASAAPRIFPGELGISYIADEDNNQCLGAGRQWAPGDEWTSAINFDTDQRKGGCQFALGVRDFTGGLTGLALSYRWEGEPGAEDSQCLRQGTYLAPVTLFPAFGPSIGIDTDSRLGGCRLTFAVSGRTDFALDVQYWAEDDESQCQFELPQGQWRSALPGSPVTIGIDTDQRKGGCLLSLRLRRF